LDSYNTESYNYARTKSDIEDLIELKYVILSSRFLGGRTMVPKTQAFHDILFQLPPDQFRPQMRMDKLTFDYIYDLIQFNAVFHNGSNNKQMDVLVRIQMAVAFERVGCDGNGGFFEGHIHEWESLQA
jgi:hypothetical protein